MYSLSVCLIAKNEEKLIGNCLESLKDVAQEIIVVDTGSTDQTISIAQSYGAKVIRTRWQNDFSKARNLSLQYATKDWILVIDCDEKLLPSEAAKLKLLLSTDLPYEALHFKLDNWVDDRIISSAMVLRLFRNRKSYHFSGKMHEQVSPSIVAISGLSSISNVEIALSHYGYDNAISSQSFKSDRNLELLLSYDNADKNDYYYFALGNEYVRTQEYFKAIDCYLTCLNLCENMNPKPTCFPYSVMYLSNVYYHLGYYHKVIENCDLNEPFLPDFKDLYLIKTLAYQEMGKYYHALTYLNRYKSCIQTNFSYPSNQLSSVNIDTLSTTLAPRAIAPSLYTILFITKSTPSLIDSIKNIASISHKIFAFIPHEISESVKDTIQKLTYLGIEIIYVNSFQDAGCLNMLYEQLANQWVLLLNDNEMVHYSVVPLLNDIIATPEYTHYAFNLYNWQTHTASTGLRFIHVVDETSLITIPPTLGPTYITVYQNYDSSDAK